jgi:hypothetical protein
MLVSHRKQFIFTKTEKTAGTSVESYFEQYCMPDGEWQESHYRGEHVSEAGIIGYRGPDPRGSTYYHHMSAERIRDLVGQDTWQRYFKFTVVRNPFDKLLSYFFWLHRPKKSSASQRLKAVARRMIGGTHRMAPEDLSTTISRFRRWLREEGVVADRDKYLIDGRECVDYFIRFENLMEGVKHVCDRISVPFEASRIPEFKQGTRPEGMRTADFYDRETEQIVRELYGWELERFGDSLPK